MPCSSVCNGGPDNTLGRFRPSKMSHMSISASLPSAAPWRNLSWGLFLPLVFAGNVVMATLAWIIVLDHGVARCRAERGRAMAVKMTMPPPRKESHHMGVSLSALRFRALDQGVW